MNRLDGLDIARFLAFFGMVIVNFKVVMMTEVEPIGLLSTLMSSLEGRAAASFVVLAGIGLGLARNKPSTLPTTLKRALFLFVIGLLNAIIFEADILHYYALYFLIGAFLLTKGIGVLVASIIGVNLVFLGMLFGLDYDAGWNWDDLSYAGFWTVDGFIRNLFFNGWHPVFPWMSFLLFGLILSHLDLRQITTQTLLFLMGSVGLIATKFLSIYAVGVTANDPELSALFYAETIPPTPLFILAGISAASALIGFCLLITKGVTKMGLLQIIQPAGRQTLTLYIAHIYIGMGMLEFMGLFGDQPPQTVLIAATAFSLSAIMLTWAWSKVADRGPIESIMRKLTS